MCWHAPVVCCSCAICMFDVGRPAYHLTRAWNCNNPVAELLFSLTGPHTSCRSANALLGSALCPSCQSPLVSTVGYIDILWVCVVVFKLALAPQWERDRPFNGIRHHAQLKEFQQLYVDIRA